MWLLDSNRHICWVCLFLLALVVTGITPLVRRRVWRSQCRAMACQRWVGRRGGGGSLGGSVLAGQGGPPDASSPLSCCVVKRQAQQGVYWETTAGRTNTHTHTCTSFIVMIPEHRSGCILAPRHQVSMETCCSSLGNFQVSCQNPDLSSNPLMDRDSLYTLLCLALSCLLLYQAFTAHTHTPTHLSQASWSLIVAISNSFYLPCFWSFWDFRFIYLLPLVFLQQFWTLPDCLIADVPVIFMSGSLLSSYSPTAEAHLLSLDLPQVPPNSPLEGVFLSTVTCSLLRAGITLKMHPCNLLAVYYLYYLNKMDFWNHLDRIRSRSL